MPLSRLRAALQRTRLEEGIDRIDALPRAQLTSTAGPKLESSGLLELSETGLKCLTFVIQDSIMYMQRDHVMINGSEPPLPLIMT
jgi:hypothetical protein